MKPGYANISGEMSGNDFSRSVYFQERYLYECLDGLMKLCGVIGSASGANHEQVINFFKSNEFTIVI